MPKSPKLRKFILSTLFFMIAVPFGAVIINRSRDAFIETMCRMAGPYIILTWYAVFHKKKQHKP